MKDEDRLLKLEFGSIQRKQRIKRARTQDMFCFVIQPKDPMLAGCDEQCKYRLIGLKPKSKY